MSWADDDALRLKELRCLIAVTELTQRNTDTAELCRRTLDYLISGMQFPAIAVPVVEINEERHVGTGYHLGLDDGLHADVPGENGVVGRVSVFYREARPFLLAEHALLKGIAQTLGLWHQRMTAEKAVRARGQLAQQLLASAAEGIFGTDMAGRCLFINPAGAQMLGYGPAADLVGCAIHETIHHSRLDGSAYPASECPMFKPLHEGVGTHVDSEVLWRADGSVLPVDYWAYPMYSDGHVVGSVVTFVDITERRKAAEALSEAHDQLLAIFEGIDEIVYVADPTSYELLYVNPALKRLWGKDARGKKCYRVLQNQDRPCDFCTNDKIFGDNLGKGYAWEFENKVSQRWYRCADKAIRWADGRWVRFELASDITEQKLAEQERTRYHQMLEQEVDKRTINLTMRTEALMQANRDLESFSYSVSHDLRAPLRAIDGFLNILKEDYASVLDEEGLRLFGIVQDNARKMGGLIDDILAFSRAGRLQLQRVPIDMNSMVDQVWAQISELYCEQPAQFRRDDLPAAYGDPNALRQIWQNLFDNARKFSRERNPAIVEVRATQDSNEVRYEVKDNGIGFNMEYANKLFVLFQRLHGMDEFQGTGVGLAIVKRFVEKHGGTVYAQAELDRGATFSFTLPLLRSNQMCGHSP